MKINYRQHGGSVKLTDDRGQEIYATAIRLGLAVDQPPLCEVELCGSILEIIELEAVPADLFIEVAGRRCRVVPVEEGDT